MKLAGLQMTIEEATSVVSAFDIDGDGILAVTAKDLNTNRDQAIRISASGGLSADQVENLISEAEEHAEGDAQRCELIELKNTGGGLIYSVEQALTEYGDSLEDEEREEVEQSLGLAKKALNETDAEALRQAVEGLQQMAYRMTEAMYERMSES